MLARLVLTIVLLGEGADICRGQEVPDDTIAVSIDTVVVIGLRQFPLDDRGMGRMTELQAVPGRLLDPVRAIALVPAALALSDLAAIPSIAGDEPERILTLLDGFPLVTPYRLLGGFSLFNPLLTRSVAATASGYPVVYGGYRPASLTVESESGFISSPRAQAELTPVLSTAAVGFPLDREKLASLLLGIRASHVQGITPFVGSATVERIRAFTPSLLDGHAILTITPQSEWNLLLHTIFSSESGALSNFGRDFAYKWRKGLLGARFVRPAGTVAYTARLSYSYDAVGISTRVPLETVGERQFQIDATFREARLVAMGEWVTHSFGRLLAGGEGTWTMTSTAISAFTEWLARRSPLDSHFGGAAAFLQSEWPITATLSVVLGIRASYSGSLGKIGLEPRGSVTVTPGPSTAITLAAGRYLYAPSDLQLLHGFLALLSTPNQPPRMVAVTGVQGEIDFEQSDAVSITATQDVEVGDRAGARLTLFGYLKSESRVLQSRRFPAVFTPLDSSAFEPSQDYDGMKYGGGVACEVRLARLPASIFVAATTQGARVRNPASGVSFPTATDIPFSFKVLGQYRPGAWTLSVAFQRYSGYPATRQYFLRGSNILGGVFYVPVWKELNSDRLPAYVRLDLGIAREFSIGEWSLEPFVDIVNLLNTKNISHYTFSYSASEPENTRLTPEYHSLPFLPTVGIRLARAW